MPKAQHVKLLRRSGRQVFCIPAEFELPGEEAIVHRQDDRLVIEPVRKRNLLAFLETIEPFDGDIPEADDPPPAAEKIF